MSIYAVYYSPTDNTKKIVDAIALGMSDEATFISFTTPKDREKAYSFSKDDIVVVGLPVYGGRVPKMVLPFLKSLKGNNARAVAVITYGNRAYEDALLELCDILNEVGFITTSAGAFIGEHSINNLIAKGRPNGDDIELAMSFGKGIISANSYSKVVVPGNYPYIEKENKGLKLAPITTDACLSCGLCAKSCPVEAIDFNDYTKVDSNKCIKCHSCVSKCPVAAKVFNQLELKKMQDMMYNSFGTIEKEPEIYF